MTPLAVSSHLPNCGTAGHTATRKSDIVELRRKRKYDRRPGRRPRDYPYKYILPSLQLDCLLDQYIDIYETRKQTPTLVEKLLKRTGKLFEGNGLQALAEKRLTRRDWRACQLPGKKKRKRAALSQQMLVDELNVLLATHRTINESGAIVETPVERNPTVTVRMFEYRRHARRPSLIHRGDVGLYRSGPGAPRAGRARHEVRGPGDKFLIDATTADVYLVSSLARHIIIGRPTIYFIIDLYSAMIVGLYIGMRPPSRAAAALALESMVMSKAAFCAQFGFIIKDDDWPARYCGRHILTDRGTEYMSIEPWCRVTRLLQMGIDHSPPCQPIWRAVSERRFGSVPGTYNAHTAAVVEKDFPERTTRYYPWDAVATIEEFTLSILSGIHIYHRTEVSGLWVPPEMTFSGLPGTPLNYWNYGVEHGSGMLREVTVSDVRKATWERDSGKITPRGLQTKEGIIYTSPVIERELRLLVGSKAKSVDILRHPDRLEQIYFDNRGYLEVASLSGVNDLTLTGVTRSEFEMYRDRKSFNATLNALEQTASRQRHASDTRRRTITSRATTAEVLRQAGLRHPITIEEDLKRSCNAHPESPSPKRERGTTKTSDVGKAPARRLAKKALDDAALDALNDGETNAKKF
ncbi:hypothetical protein PQQ87_34285 [Paraburkholderia nemoris]|uniref:hypothetical protein n=1 Tax=Paraburkholderia nemoris TaxID=2793076 RepID=UPI0038BAD3F9